MFEKIGNLKILSSSLHNIYLCQNITLYSIVLKMKKVFKNFKKIYCIPPVFLVASHLNQYVKKV
jgi:hypothetical protein